MNTNPNFKFKTNISIDGYQSKADASACLSSIGAKAIGKSKMAFVQYDVTVQEFLMYATSGHAFCNLFAFDPDALYEYTDKKGRTKYEYPVYRRGTNKGGMKLKFKSDAFFSGGQTVFVDIDLTRFSDVRDYLSVLTYAPTCVYMSFSDKKDKNGIISRRFRMVYIFDSVLGKEDLKHVAKCINDQIIIDTQEPMDDDCGTRVCQYFNGVFGNNETYCSDIIYSLCDFPSLMAEVDDELECNDVAIQFDEQMVYDMQNMSYDDITHYYSWQYKYVYRSEGQEWIDGLFQFTSEGYLQLWYYREPVLDGNHRRRKLFRNACLRLLMCPDMDCNTLLYNLYIDLCRFFDNSDGVITLDTLKRKVKNAYKMSHNELLEYCSWNIEYWQEHRPQFIVHSGYALNWGVVSDIKKRIKWKELDEKYDRTKSVQENIEAGINIPKSTLYRYCKAKWIDTNPNKGITAVQERKAKRKEKEDMISRFVKFYNPGLSVRENKDELDKYGISLSVGTIHEWSRKYLSVSNAQTVFTNEHYIFEVPEFEFELDPANYNLPNHSNEMIESYSWNVA